MMARRLVGIGALLLLAGCSGAPPPVALKADVGATATRLWLEAGPGWKINALLPPAFEPVGGPPVRFTARRLTPDSAYYAEPPVAFLPRRGAPSGILRASVCAAGEQICRPYVRTFGS
jgi:hypothetical protein